MNNCVSAIVPVRIPRVFPHLVKNFLVVIAQVFNLDDGDDGCYYWCDGAAAELEVSQRRVSFGHLVLPEAHFGQEVVEGSRVGVRQHEAGGLVLAAGRIRQQGRSQERTQRGLKQEV